MIYSVAEEYKEVNATIWLTKGDHFFFQCDLNSGTHFRGLDKNN